MITMHTARLAGATFALGTLALGTLAAQVAKPRTTLCLAPTTAQMASGSTADGATAVRETLGSYLTGPTLAVVPLHREAVVAGARGSEAGGVQVRRVHLDEAGAQEERRRLVRQDGRRAPCRAARRSCAGAASSTAGRVVANAAASAAAEAARGFASNVKTQGRAHASSTASRRSTARVVAKDSARPRHRPTDRTCSRRWWRGGRGDRRCGHAVTACPPPGARGTQRSTTTTRQGGRERCSQQCES